MTIKDDKKFSQENLTVQEIYDKSNPKLSGRGQP
jgi:hypothetical protein